MANSNYRKRNTWSYSQKPKFENKLTTDVSGFLCTCNAKITERDCVKEAYNLLNEFADLMYGPEFNFMKKSVSEEQEGDIDTDFKKELNELKSNASNDKTQLRRFESCKSGAHGIVFIKTSISEPSELVHKIVSTISETKQRKSKFLLRLLPVEITCKATLKDIEEKCKILFDKYFTQTPVQFSVVFNHRNNHSLKRDDLIEALASLVYEKNPDNKANLKDPDLVILVEVIRSVCCLAVVKDYYKYKKYNLLEIVNNTGIAASQNVESSDTVEDNDSVNEEQEIEAEDEEKI